MEIFPIISHPRLVVGGRKEIEQVCVYPRTCEECGGGDEQSGGECGSPCSADDFQRGGPVPCQCLLSSSASLIPPMQQSSAVGNHNSNNNNGSWSDTETTEAAGLAMGFGIST